MKSKDPLRCLICGFFFQKGDCMSRLLSFASWSLICLGVAFLLVSPLLAPETAFADTGACPCSCGSCDPAFGGDPNGTYCKTCLDNCSACAGDPWCEAACCQRYCGSSSDPDSCASNCCATYCGTDTNCLYACSESTA